MDIYQLLKDSKIIAVPGCSAKPYRTSYQIARFMQSKGYRIIPVNPNYEEILDEKSYASLREIPQELKIDIINIFRNPEHTIDVLREAVEWKQMSGQNPVIWTQLGVSTAEAEALAEQNDFPYIRNRCIKIEYFQYFNDRT